MVIEQLRGWRAAWVQPLPERGAFRGKTVPQGDVQMYSLTGRPKAESSCGWSYCEADQFSTILELPPVDSAPAAVKVVAAKETREAQ
jgi:hypothetical protein